MGKKILLPDPYLVPFLRYTHPSTEFGRAALNGDEAQVLTRPAQVNSKKKYLMGGKPIEFALSTERSPVYMPGDTVKLHVEVMNGSVTVPLKGIRVELVQLRGSKPKVAQVDPRRVVVHSQDVPNSSVATGDRARLVIDVPVPEGIAPDIRDEGFRVKYEVQLVAKPATFGSDHVVVVPVCVDVNADARRRIESSVEKSAGGTLRGGQLKVSTDAGLPPAVTSDPTFRAHYRAMVQRVDAEALLAGKPPGAYVLRPARDPATVVVVSFVNPATKGISHSLVRYDARGWTFVSPGAADKCLPTLKALLDYHELVHPA
jgi:hypothetical protein